MILNYWKRSVNMVYLLHGENQVLSREKLMSLVADLNLETVYLDGKKSDQADFVNACESNSLFAVKKAIVVENFFRRVKSREKTAIESYLFNSDFANDLIFWEDRKIDRVKSLNLPQKVKILSFDYDANMFKFLDSLGRLPYQDIYKTFHLLLKSNDVELVFSMLVRQLRFLIMTKSGPGNITGLPDWQFYKFASQSKMFKLDSLVSLYRQLLQIDYRIKTGQTPLKKDQLLDILFMNF